MKHSAVYCYQCAYVSISKVSFSICSTTTQQTTQNSSSLSPQHDAHTWLDGLNSPLIQDEGDSKMLKLRFDVSQYTPEEIVVKTVDNKLLVSKTTISLLRSGVNATLRCLNEKICAQCYSEQLQNRTLHNLANLAFCAIGEHKVARRNGINQRVE